jgi:hypothetical protein
MKIHSLKLNSIGSEHCVMVINNTAGKFDDAVVRHTKVGKAGIELDE